MFACVYRLVAKLRHRHHHVWTRLNSYSSAWLCACGYMSRGYPPHTNDEGTN